jgi:DHA1 family tetracycline resistance protein-like MFS transporter
MTDPAIASPAPPAATMRFVVATLFVDAIGFGIVLPVVPDLIMTLGHADVSQATAIGGWLAAVYAVAGFLLGPLMGNLGDRFGRRPVLLASLAGLGLDYLLMAGAPSLVWLFVGRMIAGALGASYVSAYAAIADISAAEDRARRFGLVSAAFGIGFVVGPAIGGLLGMIGPRAPFWLAAALSLANFVYGLLRFPETLPPALRRPFAWARANPLGALASLRLSVGVLPLAVVNFLWIVASTVYPATWSFWAIARFDWSPGDIGASLAFFGILMALIQVFLLDRIIKRIGEPAAALIGLASGAGSFIALAFVTQGWMVYLVMLLGSFECLVMPALGSLMSARVGADAQGELQGFNGSITALGSIVAPLVLNPVLAYFTSDAAPFRFAGAAFLLAAIVATAAFVMLALQERAARRERTA